MVNCLFGIILYRGRQFALSKLVSPTGVFLRKGGCNRYEIPCYDIYAGVVWLVLAACGCRAFHARSRDQSLWVSVGWKIIVQKCLCESKPVKGGWHLARYAFMVLFVCIHSSYSFFVYRLVLYPRFFSRQQWREREIFLSHQAFGLVITSA